MNEDKTAAIISYYWWIGLLIAFIMNNNKRSGFTSFHIRQSIGLSIISFALGIFSRYGIDPITGMFVYSSRTRFKMSIG